MKKLLENKVAIVTGASRGIGAAIAKLFITEGAKVMICDVLNDEGKQLADQLGNHAKFISLDVSQEREWKQALDSTLEHFDGLDILVNNAGILSYGSIADTKPEEYRRVFEVNQFGTFLGMHTVIPSLKETGGGSIINISSAAGMTGCNGLISYGSSKWAIRGMSKIAAAELGEFGIRVNSVHPGNVDTPMSPPNEQGEHPQTHGLAIARVGQAEEISNMVAFLSSDKSSYTTGGEFLVDGGFGNCFVSPRLKEAGS